MYEEVAADYERKGCARDGVRKVVLEGRAANERLRPALKGVVEGDR